MERWEDSESEYSLDSWGGHIVMGKNIHCPTTTYMSAPEPHGKKKEEAVTTMVCSAPGLSSSSHLNQLTGMPGYDPNRIPASVFSTKPSNPMEWSMASNDSLFSIHMGNFSFSGEQALAALLRSGDKQKRDAPVPLKPSSNPLPLSESSDVSDLENTPEPAKNLERLEESDKDEIDDEETRGEGEEEEEEEVVKSDSDDGSEALSEDDDDDDEEEQLQEEGEDEIEEDGEVNEMKRRNQSNVAHCTSISCGSDTSNSSDSSFAFTVTENENGVKTPSMQTHNHGSKTPPHQKEFSHQQRTQSLYPQTQSQSQSQSRWKQRSEEGKTQQLKSPISRWFPCFYSSPPCC